MQGEISAIDYLEAQHVMLRAGQAVAAVLERHDLLLTPASAIPPARLGVLAMSSTDVASRLATGAATIAFSRLFNASGHPAAVVPWTLDADGLPIGVQLVAPFADEASLIRVAAMIEAVRPWGHRRPPEAALLQETFA
jgi:Asp-tRNA(Asn)/Glu-tRNA(Gln) amidotransferase A subunit family amidase